ncbi:hypothetical protein [Spirosoma pollinicola]|uniref:Uncharacterized protein n=1 Tax=Spirosoma pollinicola TaxID=2057025 RepID=A0A2K8ZAD3_9BACT|nr:hypothetical protein [Spirosoma pollinicola]AUD06823.1 hypothetical protein CWM47_36230 [Spirosoma pollinicola]
MYNPFLFLALILSSFIIESCQSNNTTKNQEAEKVEARPSKWTESKINEVSRKYKGSDFQKSQVKRLVESLQYDKTLKDFEGEIKSGKVKETIATPKLLVKDAMKYEFNMDQIAGKSPKAIEKIFGKPGNLTTVHPSGTPCPCPKKVYLNGLIEIVYMRGKADWITINLGKYAKVNSNGVSTQTFDDYTYTKAYTK